MKITLRDLAAARRAGAGGFVRYALDDVDREMTLLEALDWLNEWLVARGEPPVAFDSDCREGICGACGLVVDGRPHGPLPRHDHVPAPAARVPRRRHDHPGAVRTGVFPVVRDLVVDRGALDRVMRAGGYVSVRAGSAPEANRCPSRARSPSARSMPRRASAAARAWPPAPTGRPPSSWGPSSPTSGSCPRASPSAHAARAPWWRAADAGRLRRVLAPRRVRGGLPQGHRPRRHLAHEPRPSPRHARERTVASGPDRGHAES